MSDLRFRALVLRTLLFLIKHGAHGRASCGEISHLEREIDTLLREVKR